jgi:hypothetical protein
MVVMAAAAESADVQPRSSIDKAPIIEAEDDAVPSAFERLPDEIISQYGSPIS